jgi:hypothetical protein
MSFWDLNDGTKAESTNTFELASGNLEPIPNDTTCIGAIEEAKWYSYLDDRYISLKWRVMQPDAYANRVIFHKVKVFGMANDKDKAATADKAKRMLAAIDANAGGKLMQVTGEPSDIDLMSALVGKMMAIKCMIWEMEDSATGEKRSGNWIAAVAPSKGAEVKNPESVQPAPAAADISDEDIPF